MCNRVPQRGAPMEREVPGSFWKWKSPSCLERERSRRSPPHPPHPQPCSLCSRSGRRHLPRAPWQMSVRVAPPTINWGSSQISWGRDPQSAVKPRGMRFCSQDPPVPSGCTGPFSLLLSLGKALQLDGHGVLLGPPICGSRRMGRAGLGEKGSLCPTLQNA